MLVALTASFFHLSVETTGDAITARMVALSSSITDAELDASIAAGADAAAAGAAAAAAAALLLLLLSCDSCDGASDCDAVSCLCSSSTSMLFVWSGANRRDPAAAASCEESGWVERSLWRRGVS